MPIQRDYAFKAAQNPWHGVFARTGCQVLTDPRDLQLTIDQIDGFDASRLEAAVGQLAGATLTPVPAPTVHVVATEVVPSPTMIAYAKPAPATASGGVSGPGFSAMFLGAGTVLVATILVCRAFFGRQLAMIRSVVPHESYALRVREDSGLRSEQAEPDGPNPGNSSVELAQDAGHPAATAMPVSVTAVDAVVAPLTVKCFGGLQVACADRVLWPSREFAQEQRAWELLFFLAASPSEGVDRDTVGAALWSEMDLADVAGSLRQLRRRLRLMLVRAVPGLPEGARSEDASALGTLEQAYGLYEADLFDSPTAPPSTWAIDPGDDGTSLRQRYRKQFLDLCRTLADLHVAGGDGTYVERAIDLYRRPVQADPLDERTWRALLNTHAKRRDRSALDREWQRLIETLRAADTDASPEAETSALYRRLRSGE